MGRFGHARAAQTAWPTNNIWEQWVPSGAKTRAGAKAVPIALRAGSGRCSPRMGVAMASTAGSRLIRRSSRG
eukprot:15185264-Heterocapsa_arctica.AAC.1